MKKLGAVLLCAAMVIMMMPTMVWAATDLDSKDDFDSAIDGTYTLTGDANLKTDIPDGITLVVPDRFTLTIPAESATTVMGSKGSIRIEAGGGLVVAGDKFVGTDGNLVLDEGAYLTARATTGGLEIVVEGNATVPAGKAWSTRSDNLNNALMNTTVNGTLTVAGKFTAANNSTVTVTGSINVADGGTMQVSSEGEVAGSGKINVQSNGTIQLNASGVNNTTTPTIPNNMISIAPDSHVVSAFDASNAFADGVKLTEDPENPGNFIVDETTLPGAVNPPVVTGPSFTIVQRPAVEFWASTESSNPTEQWAEPSAQTPSTDSNKTNPSMGGRADA